MSSARVVSGSSRWAYVFAGVAFIAGIAIGYAGGHFASSQQSYTHDAITREGGYQYVNPLLSCDISENTEYGAFASLESALTAQIQGLIRQGKAKRISVYFRDMNYGAWTGVNADDIYIPASLLKVPLVVAYEREFQADASLRNKEVLLSSTTDNNAEEYIKSANDLPLGRSYSVETLMEALVRGSDNNAASVLNALVATETLNDVYNQFGIPGVSDQNTDIMSPKEYMRLFRILYNASYLPRESSQSVLKLLSETDFNGGIVAGVPAGMPVAHKFGERTIHAVNPTTKQQSVVTQEFHDCGIVYYPHSPYGICIMTEGVSFPDLESVIAALSQTAYSAVDAGLLTHQQ